MSDRYVVRSRTVINKGKSENRYVVYDLDTGEIARGTKGYQGRNSELYSSGEAKSVCRKMNKKDS